jgi:hypothetical protein
MKLPNAQSALVPSEKITNYLLDAAHPDNHGKARFFAALGFTADKWEVLAQAFRKHAQSSDVAEHLESPHGLKYVINGPIETPLGRTVAVRTVWIIDRGRNCPRLVTAYPADQ